MIATLGLALVIFALIRTGRNAAAPAAVGAYIGAAYWFTSSTSFANPAIDVGRMLSDTFAGIAPASVPGFVVAQLAGGAIALAVIRVLYPEPALALSRRRSRQSVGMSPYPRLRRRSSMPTPSSALASQTQAQPCGVSPCQLEPLPPRERRHGTPGHGIRRSTDLDQHRRIAQRGRTAHP